MGAGARAFRSFLDFLAAPHRCSAKAACPRPCHPDSAIRPPVSKVPGTGLEPASLSARASKTLVSANSTTRALGLRMADFGYRIVQGKAETPPGFRSARTATVDLRRPKSAAVGNGARPQCLICINPVKIIAGPRPAGRPSLRKSRGAARFVRRDRRRTGCGRGRTA